MFDINKCASAVAVAMVGTIHNGDDAKRFAERAMAEGFSNISDLIAADAVKQALALQAAIDKAVPLFNVHEVRVSNTVTPTPSENPLKEVADVIWPKKDEVRTAEEAFGEAPLVAPPVPSAEAPAATTSTNTTTAIASDVELDSRGLPWDGRIHASTKTRLAKDDSWKLKRGLDAEYVAQIEAELFQVMAIPNANAPSAEVTDFSQAPTPPSLDGVVPVPPETQGNAAQTVEVGTPQTGAVSKDYATWGMPELMRGMTAKKCDQEYVSQVCQQFGIPSIMAVGARKDLIPLIAEALEL